MIALLLALITQADPNEFYQNLEPARKRRVFLVYEDAVKSNSSIEGALEATAKSTNMPLGAIRMVVIEMKRKSKFEEEEKEREKAKKAKTGTTSNRPRRSSSTSSNSRSRQPRTPAKVKAKPTGDGLHKTGNREEVQYSSEKYSPFGFRERCFLIRPDDIRNVKEKIPIAVDGRVQSIMKGATVLTLTSEEGAEDSLVLVQDRSTKECSSLEENERVRVYGWTVKEHTPLEDESEITADGVLFYAMDVDSDAKNLPGLSLKAEISEADSSSSQNPNWTVSVEATNESDNVLEDLVLEANVIAMSGKTKPKDANDTTFFFIRRLEKGESATLEADVASWIDESDNSPRKKLSAEEEKAEVHVLVRPLGGKFEEK